MKKNNQQALFAGALIVGAAGLYTAYQLSQKKSPPPYRTFTNEKEPSNFLILASLSAVVGLGAGLLLAPKSGKELRQDFTDVLESIKDRTQEFANNIEEQGVDILNNVSDQASDWIEKAKTVANDVSSRVSHFGDMDEETPFSEKIENVIQMATLGLRLWNTLSKTR